MTATFDNQLHPDDANNITNEKIEVPNSHSRDRSQSPSIKERIKDFFKKSDTEASDDEEGKPKKKIAKRLLKVAEKGVAKAIETNLHHHCTDYQLSDTSVAGAKSENSSKGRNSNSDQTSENNGSGV